MRLWRCDSRCSDELSNCKGKICMQRSLFACNKIDPTSARLSADNSASVKKKTKVLANFPFRFTETQSFLMKNAVNYAFINTNLHDWSCENSIWYSVEAQKESFLQFLATKQRQLWGGKITIAISICDQETMGIIHRAL